MGFHSYLAILQLNYQASLLVIMQYLTSLPDLTYIRKPHFGTLWKVSGKHSVPDVWGRLKARACSLTFVYNAVVDMLQELA